MNPLFAFREDEDSSESYDLSGDQLEWDHPVWISLLWMGFGAWVRLLDHSIAAHHHLQL